MGAVLWLHHGAAELEALAGLEPAGAGPIPRAADRAVLVSPPHLPPVVTGNGFPVPPLSPAGVRAAAHSTRLVGSLNDQYWPEAGAIRKIARPLGLPVDQIDDGGHFEPFDGYGPWPGMLAWCLGEADHVTR